MADSDWRLQGQGRYLHGATLYRRVWTQTRPHWDHDHCEFWRETFSTSDRDLHEGYTTDDDYRWICEQCFTDFRERFQWQLG